MQRDQDDFRPVGMSAWEQIDPLCGSFSYLWSLQKMEERSGWEGTTRPQCRRTVEITRKRGKKGENRNKMQELNFNLAFLEEFDYYLI